MGTALYTAAVVAEKNGDVFQIADQFDDERFDDKVAGAVLYLPLR